MRKVAPLSTSIDLLGRMKRDPRSTAAWSEFSRIYDPLIRSWCRDRGVSDVDVDDIGQDVRLKLLSVFGRFLYDPARTFRGWLRTVVEHAVADHRRRLNRLGQGSGSTEVLRVLQVVPDRSHDQADQFDRELLERAMANVRARVSEENWKAFLLNGIEGRPVAEVESELGIHAGKVYVARCRIQKMLSREIRQLNVSQRG